MEINTHDILLTDAELWYAEPNIAPPDANAIGPGDDWGTGWNYGGLMEDALTVVEEVEYTEHGAQKMAPIKRSRKSQVFSFKGSLAEVSAAHKALVRGYDPARVVATTPAGPSQIGLETFDPNAGGGCGRGVKEWQIALEGLLCTPDDDLGFVRIFISKGNFMSDGDVVFDGKGDGVKLPWVFKALWNPDHLKGVAYRFQRMLAVASA